MTREQAAAALKRIKRALHNRITIVRQIVRSDGTVIGEIRKTVSLLKEETRDSRTSLARIKKRKEQA